MQSFSKGLLGGDQGSLTLALLPLLGLFVLFLMISGKKLILLNEERKQREQTYLCLKETMDRFVSLATFIKRTNVAILGLNTAMIIKPNPTLPLLKRSIQISQQIKTSSIQIKLQRFCRGLQMTFPLIANPIVMIGLKLKRSPSGTAVLKKKQKNFLLPSKRLSPFLFVIRGKIDFIPQLGLMKTREIFLGPKIKAL